MTDAHKEQLNLSLVVSTPEHEPRESDPHYKLFNQAKARIKKQGLWKCIINDDLCSGEPELHHSHIEFSQINNMDEKKIEEAFGLHFTNDEEFQEWIESPGNLEVLCTSHHRTLYGIHAIPDPLWQAIRFRKNGTEAAAQHVTKEK
jgi:3-methyladenine DNA glycosylase/8-oxoguanine DNA glycosylase